MTSNNFFPETPMRRYIGKEKKYLAAKFDCEQTELIEEIALEEDKYVSDILREALEYWLKNAKGYELAA